jgi:hypothetical protein
MNKDLTDAQRLDKRENEKSLARDFFRSLTRSEQDVRQCLLLGFFIPGSIFKSGLRSPYFENGEVMISKSDPRIRYESFRAMVRAMPYWARTNGTVTYRQMCNTVGIPWQLAGLYCGALGEFCLENDWPILNSLVVNEATERPGSDFKTWKNSVGCTLTLGAVQAKCRAYFRQFKSHSEMSKLVYSGIDQKIKNFLDI